MKNAFEVIDYGVEQNINLDLETINDLLKEPMSDLLWVVLSGIKRAKSCNTLPINSFHRAAFIKAKTLL